MSSRVGIFGGKMIERERELLLFLLFIIESKIFGNRLRVGNWINCF